MNAAYSVQSTIVSLTTSSLPHETADADRHLTLLQGVIEGLPDGIIILTDEGEILYQNNSARRICHQLSNHLSSKETIPAVIWRRCQALLENYQTWPDHSVVIEDEIKTGELIDIRIRVRWIDANKVKPRLLVTLEDQYQSAQFKAIAEAHRYHLTDRETEVWLLKRVGYTYKAIAAKLHIAEDTVKKHIKSIHARREATEWACEANFS